MAELERNESFEAIYRLADFLHDETQRTGVHHQMGYLAAANFLKHSGYTNSGGEPYDDTHAKAAGVLIDRAWEYAKDKYGRPSADKIFRAFCDKDGINRSRNY